MRKLEVVVRALVLLSITVGGTGCFSSPVNDLINGGVKLANGQVGDLTAGELKAVSDAVLDVASNQFGQTVDRLTPEQAQALVDFLDANNITTFDELATFAQNAEQDPSTVQGLDALSAAFAEEIANFNANDFDAAQFEAMMHGIFGGMGGSNGGSTGPGGGSPAGA